MNKGSLNLSTEDFVFFKKNNKFIQHAVNGFSRFLILWIIRYNKNIHGYAIMKELDKFVETLIEAGVLKKSSSSKIYPILKKMEEEDLIVGDWKVHDNKQVRYYSITDKGELLLAHIHEQRLILKDNPQWKLLNDDMNRAWNSSI